MYENATNVTKQTDIISLGSFEDDLEGESVSHRRSTGRGRGKAAGRRRLLVSTPITEDWRKSTKSVEGLQTKNRCINYKEVYNGMKHTHAILDRNLVGILEYFKVKAEEDMGMICSDEPIVSSGQEILEVEHADAFGQYFMPNMVEQGSLYTSPIEPLERNTDIQG